MRVGSFLRQRVWRIATKNDRTYAIVLELKSKGLLETSADTFEFSVKVLRLMRM